jgi:hypothetical protein
VRRAATAWRAENKNGIERFTQGSPRDPSSQ